MDLIEAIPQLLQYFVPGFLLLSILSFFMSERLAESTATLWIIVSSFVIVSLIQVVDDQIFLLTSLTEWGMLLAEMFAAVVLAILIYFVLHTKRVQGVIQHISNKSVHQSIWPDIVDLKKGTSFKVFLKDSDTAYIGTLLMMEEKGHDSWIVLCEYSSCDATSGDTIFDATAYKYASTVAIHMSEISRIELFYSMDSQPPYERRTAPNAASVS